MGRETGKRLHDRTHTRAERAKYGKALRSKVPRQSHKVWKLSRDHDRDPIKILEQSNRGRLPELVPIRYGRMLRNPFAFLRGSAAVMTYDLASTPATGLRVQACGDCHVSNFGLFATPERHLIFDLNDFDETHPAPWEWDLKRLTCSIVVAARSSGLSDREARDAVFECVSSYRKHMRDCSRLSPMEIWYEALDIETLIAEDSNLKVRKAEQQLADQARKHIAEHLFPKIAEARRGRYRLIDQPPILFHDRKGDFEDRANGALAAYRQSLSDERRTLLDHYRLHDFALKVVGIGSVGTRCYVGLFISDKKHPLLLQFKEADRSVLEPYTIKSKYENQGERVVMGQRLMQSSSDIFLGWARSKHRRDFYVRQLRDMKLSFPIEVMSSSDLARYTRRCGWLLARAHAKSGDAAAISGYLGKGDIFDRALGKFASAYADQTEHDHATLVQAVRSGRLEALRDE